MSVCLKTFWLKKYWKILKRFSPLVNGTGDASPLWTCCLNSHNLRVPSPIPILHRFLKHWRNHQVECQHKYPRLSFNDGGSREKARLGRNSVVKQFHYNVSESCQYRYVWPGGPQNILRHLSGQVVLKQAYWGLCRGLWLGRLERYLIYWKSQHWLLPLQIQDCLIFKTPKARLTPFPYNLQSIPETEVMVGSSIHVDFSSVTDHPLNPSILYMQSLDRKEYEERGRVK